MTLKEKRIEWKARYDAWKESGQRIAEWCRDQGIKTHQMYYWVRQFSRGGSCTETPVQTQWLAVQVEESLPSSGQGPIFLHVDAISVEVRPGANLDLLTDVIRVLRHQC